VDADAPAGLAMPTVNATASTAAHVHVGTLRNPRAGRYFRMGYLLIAQ
jgi:hypothetical protein